MTPEEHEREWIKRNVENTIRQLDHKIALLESVKALMLTEFDQPDKSSDNASKA